MPSSPRFDRNKTWISQLCLLLVCSEPLLTSRCFDSKGDAEQLSHLPAPHMRTHHRFTPHSMSFTPHNNPITPQFPLITRSQTCSYQNLCIHTSQQSNHTIFLLITRSKICSYQNLCYSHSTTIQSHHNFHSSHTHKHVHNFHSSHTHKHVHVHTV